MNQHLLFKCCKTSLVSLILLFVSNTTSAQPKKARVLFVGNSYTYFNNMPQIVAEMAATTGDTLEFDMSAPGGASFFNHIDPSFHYFLSTTKKLREGGWDYVVLQEQSMNPAMQPESFYRWSFTYAKMLVDSVRFFNPCAEIIFYMTWGRKNGIGESCKVYPDWPYLCAYHTMDSVIRSRYMEMADSTSTTVSPAGAVWRYIRHYYPGIELYEGDESHPVPAGSYAVACSMYTAIFKKPAEFVTFDFSLNANVAGNIRTAATKVVFDSLSAWRIKHYETIAGFSHSADRMKVSFTNNSVNATRYDWDFGDGKTSTALNPVHTYTAAKNYTVRLKASGASCSDTMYARLNINPDPNAIIIAPNPVFDKLYITSALDNYRIQIVNSMGQLVYDKRASGSATQAINVLGLARGLYTVRICTTRMIYGKKIIIR